MNALARAKSTILLITAAGLPLAFFGRLEDEPFDVTKLALLLAGVSGALGIHLVQAAAGRRARGLRQVALPALVLTLPLSISWLFSPYQEWAILGTYSRFNGLLPYVAFAVLGLLLVDAFWDRPETLAWALAITGGVVGAYALVQALGLDPLWRPGMDAGSPFPPSTIGHYNFVGGVLAVSLPASVYLWLRSERGWVGMGLTIATVTGLILCNSQGGWVAAVAGVVIVVGSFTSASWPGAVIAGRVAAGLIAFGVILAVALSANLRSPIFGGTAKSRGLLWGTALEMGADSPLFGSGPASYAIEGVRYRPLESVLLEENTKADDPHSVPLSFWANAGALGVAGFLALAYWIRRRGIQPIAPDHLVGAFFASCVAYLVQSLVSIDVLSLRSALWIALAGLAISSSRADRTTRETAKRVKVSLRQIGITAVGVTVAVTGLWYAAGLIRAHRAFASGNHLFDDGRIELAMERFEEAAAFRFEPWYLDSYGRHLARAALEQGPSGAPLMDQMSNVYTYLGGFPETFGLLDAAQGFHDWAHFEPSASRDALRYLERARAMDPENPDIDVRISEALIRSGRSDGARAMLESWTTRLRGRLPGFWGALSIARLLDGDPEGAEQALAEGADLDGSDCRVIAAQEILMLYLNRSSDVDPAAAFAIRYNCGLGPYLYFTDLVEKVNDL